MRPTVQRIFMGFGNHGSVGSIDYMHINNLVPTSTVSEDVRWLFGFNCITGRLPRVQNRRLKANISLPTFAKEISAINTNFEA